MTKLALAWGRAAPDPPQRAAGNRQVHAVGDANERHPGTLNLDIDTLSPLIGGWQQRSVRVLQVLRPIALAMAGAHLRDGYDVVVPQYLAELHEIAEFETVAHDAGADFCEVVLLDERERSIARYDERARTDPDPWIRYSRRTVDEQGGAAFLAQLHDALVRVVDQRPAAVVHSRPGAIDDTYDLVVTALQQTPPPASD